MTPREAVEFFALKIEQQAAKENVLLTDVEKLILRCGVDADGGEASGPWEQFERDYEPQTYEDKTGTLLLHAFEIEQNDRIAGAKWAQAKSALNEHDYYILGMVWRVFPELKPNFSPVRKPSSIADQVIYLAIALGIVSILFYFVLRAK